MNRQHGMQAIVVGSGSATPDPIRGNPSMAVIVDGEALLFDCGERATVNLVRAGISPLDVNHLFFTHLHWDHIADYNYLLMIIWNCGKLNTLNVHGPIGTKEMTTAFLQAHKVDVAFVKRFLEILPPHITQRPGPEPLLNVREISDGTVLQTDSYQVTAREVEHLNLLGFEHSSYGYRIDSDYGSVAISGDSVPSESVVELARGVDLLLHECTFLEEVIEERNCWTGHTGPKGAGRIARRAGAKKLVLTHLGPYNSGPLAISMAISARRTSGPEVWSKILREAASEYSGPIVLAEDAMAFDINRLEQA